VKRAAEAPLHPHPEKKAASVVVDLSLEEDEEEQQPPVADPVPPPLPASSALLRKPAKVDQKAARSKAARPLRTVQDQPVKAITKMSMSELKDELGARSLNVDGKRGALEVRLRTGRMVAEAAYQDQRTQRRGSGPSAGLTFAERAALTVPPSSSARSSDDGKAAVAAPVAGPAVDDWAEVGLGAGFQPPAMEEEEDEEGDDCISEALSSDSEEEDEEDEELLRNWPKSPPSSPPAPQLICAGCHLHFIGAVLRLLDDDHQRGCFCCHQCVVDFLVQKGHAQ
jgi:hypothetical protein